MKLRYGDPDEAGMSAQRVRHVAQLAQSWVEQGITPSLVVLAARRGVIVLHEAFGRLTPDDDSPPLARDALFPLASISKPITATAVMILVEDGLLGLNRPVREYLPEFVGEGKDAVMVHHLLTHTSGLRDEDLDVHVMSKGAVPEYSIGEPPVPRLAEYLSARYDAPLWKAPGVEMSYATFNYELLGEIVTRVSPQPLRDFVRTRICEPLGMVDTHFVVPDTLRGRVVRRPSDAVAAEFLNSRLLQDEPYASGGAFSTALDTVIFGQMVLNRGCYGDARVLSPAAVAAMTRNQIPGIASKYDNQVFPEASWGLGWNVLGTKKAERTGSLRSAQSFDHDGNGGVLLWVDPVYEIVGVYFSVVLRDLPPFGIPDWCADLFMNAVTAAVVDV
ncbi:MAG TPA: serine hydrolase domain-containing protein [Chloroflexota bacterium]|nr:serine hydrolase domain-containing protein [Chloroflexota bacterium]